MSRQIQRAVLYFIIVILAFIVLLYKYQFAQSILYYDYDDENNQTEKFIINNETNDSYNIFFLETNHLRETLDVRQLCSIESAAKHNPSANVYVRVLKAKLNVSEIFETYPNIKWSIINLNEEFKETPLEEWWKSGKIISTADYVRYAHLSDILRLMYVYKYGGFYSDLDAITLKSFKPLADYNGFCAGLDEPRIQFGNGFFHFTKNHSFLFEAINDVVVSYDASEWLSVGPVMVTGALRRYCDIKNFDVLMHLGIDLPKIYYDENEKEKQPEQVVSSTTTRDTITKALKMHSCNITIFPFYVCYPVEWYRTYEIFDHGRPLDLSKIMHTYTFHFYSKATEDRKIIWNEQSMFEYLASQHCPITHNLLKRESKIEKFI